MTQAHKQQGAGEMAELKERFAIVANLTTQVRSPRSRWKRMESCRLASGLYIQTHRHAGTHRHTHTGTYRHTQIHTDIHRHT